MSNRRRTPLLLVDAGAEARFYGERVSRHGGPVLVLACAHGNIAWESCLRGAQTFAVDPSPRMVRAAEERRPSESVEVSGRLQLLCSDLRSLRLRERFPLVLAPQNAPSLMSSLDELESFFATARYHLLPGGTFLFDMANPSGQEGRMLPEHLNRPGYATLLARPDFIPHLRERKRTHEGPGHSGIRRLRIRPFFPDEVDAALTQAGLIAHERYGNFDGKPFDSKDALQVVVAAGA